MTGATIVLAVVLAVLAWSTARARSSLMRLHGQVRAAWTQLEQQLAERRDLAARMVELARGHLPTHAAALGNALSLADRAGDRVAHRQAAGEVTAALAAFLAEADRSQALRQDRGFLNLREQIASSQERIRIARQFHNDQVLIYNARLGVTALRLVAQASGLHSAELFEI